MRATQTGRMSVFALALATRGDVHHFNWLASCCYCLISPARNRLALLLSRKGRCVDVFRCCRRLLQGSDSGVEHREGRGSGVAGDKPPPKKREAMLLSRRSIHPPSQDASCCRHDRPRTFAWHEQRLRPAPSSSCRNEPHSIIAGASVV